MSNVKCDLCWQCNIIVTLPKCIICLSYIWRAITSRHTTRPIAARYVARFPSHVWIRCVAPESFWLGIGIAAIVLCCRATSIRIIVINWRMIIWYVRIIRWPLLTCSSTHSRVQRSHVLTAEMSPLTFWIEWIFTSLIYYKLVMLKLCDLTT